MPELPEVETVARQLLPKLKGRRITSVLVYDPKLATASYKKLRGTVATDVFRRGKQIVARFSSPDAKEEYALVIHLRMSGRAIWQPSTISGSAKSFYSAKRRWDSESLPKPHLRAEFAFASNALQFIDPRRFGTIELYSWNALPIAAARDPFLKPLTGVELSEMIAGSKQPIKSFLLRQDKIAGIGNIYASEILFRSRIHPHRAAGSLSLKECNLLSRVTSKVLAEAVKNCGTTFSDFQNAHGELGNYQRFLRVYHREGDNCRRCRSDKIRRIVQAQRSTFFCPTCQRFLTTYSSSTF